MFTYTIHVLIGGSMKNRTYLCCCLYRTTSTIGQRFLNSYTSFGFHSFQFSTI